MTRLTLQIIAGVLLSGCTVNNFHDTAVSAGDRNYVEQDKHKGIPSILETEMPPTEITLGNFQIRAECKIYVPLPVPKPVRVDFKELEAAQTSKEINAIALRNVKELHLQINNYAAKQQKHYNEYVRRCAVR